MVNISTSEFIKYKPAIIDGVELGFRIPNSAETLELIELQEQTNKDKTNRSKSVSRLVDIVFNLCDQPDKAREILSDLPVEAVMDIYTRVIESE